MILTSRHAVVVGLDHGDEGKGKVVAELSKLKRHGNTSHFTHCVRFNGGPNAGHTIYLDNGKKAITHIIPTGVLFGLIGIIGKGCVLNVKGFFEELSELEEALGQRLSGRILIDPMVHIISDEHMEEDAQTDKIGSTKRGIAPVYSDKMLRKGKLARDCEELSLFVHEHDFNPVQCNYLFEGAQGFYLDPDHGDYPYVTSSGCLPHNIHNTGFPYGEKVHVVGVCKAYSTYVGAKNFAFDQKEAGYGWSEEELEEIEKALKAYQELGQEFGATTGRQRQVNVLKLRNIYRAAEISGCDTIIVNKCDILDQANFWVLDDCWAGSTSLVVFPDQQTFREAFTLEMPVKPEIIFSSSPDEI